MRKLTISFLMIIVLMSATTTFVGCSKPAAEQEETLEAVELQEEQSEVEAVEVIEEANVENPKN